MHLNVLHWKSVSDPQQKTSIYRNIAQYKAMMDFVDQHLCAISFEYSHWFTFKRIDNTEIKKTCVSHTYVNRQQINLRCLYRLSEQSVFASSFFPSLANFTFFTFHWCDRKTNISCLRCVAVSLSDSTVSYGNAVVLVNSDSIV